MFNRLINSRITDARLIKNEANKIANSGPPRDKLNNGEEEEYPYSRGPRKGQLSYIANFSKGLRHNSLGEVLPDAYRTMVRSMYSTDPKLFERRWMMGTINGLNLINPQGGLAYDLEGPDVQSVSKSGKLLPGEYTTQFETGAIASGIYYYRIITDSYSKTNKLIIQH